MSDQSTTERIAELKKLAEAATPGTWKATQEYANRWRIDQEPAEYYELASVFGQGDHNRIANNAAYIAAANPQAILSLIERIAELEKALREIKDMTDANNTESYRCDDREGCLDAVHSTASNALAAHQKEDKA